LDAALLAIVTPYFSGFWLYATNPTNVALMMIILSVVGIVTFSLLTFYLVIRHWGMLKSSQKESTVDIYSHTNLPPIKEMLSGVNRTIHFLGITLESLNHVIPSIETLLRDNKRVRILVCDPATNLMPEIERLVVSKNTAQRIEATVAMLNQMNNDYKNNLEIRMYREIPTQGMIIVDPDTDSAYMHVEPYPPMTAQEYRRIIKITHREHGNLFEMYWSAYNRLWNHLGTN
jgi:hypothetical protein